MSKIIEFKKDDAVEERCDHQMLDVTDDAIYCRNCGVGIKATWVVRQLNKIVISDYSSGNTVNLKWARLQIEERRKYENIKSLDIWIDELVKEKDALCRQVTNKMQAITDLKYEYELLRQPDIFGD